MSRCKGCGQEFTPKKASYHRPPFYCSQGCYFARGGTSADRLARRRLYMRDYMRRRRGGGPVRPKRPNGSGHITKSGYMVVRAVEHPVAMYNGQTFLHRKVLYDAIGPGEHPCHWCGRLVSWAVRWPDSGALIVDHLNGIKLDNAVENLEPSCRGCNTSVAIARGQLVALQREVEELRALLAGRS